jgi:hypothetical protein
VAFIDPANSGTSNVKPASITNGAETVVSSGDAADDIRLDVRSLFQKFIDAEQPADVRRLDHVSDQCPCIVDDDESARPA